MLRDAAVALIKARLVRTADTTLDASVVTEMQYVQKNKLEIGFVFPWFLLTDWVSLATVANVETVALPADFLMEHEESDIEILNPDDGTYLPLDKDESGTLARYFTDDETGFFPALGQPTAYALDGTKLVLRPVPNAVYTIRLKHYAKAAVLTSNIENAWLANAEDVIIGETGMIIAGAYLRDTEAEARFSSMASAAWKRLWDYNELRKSVNREYQMQYGQGTT
jgi:hypothetical protein